MKTNTSTEQGCRLNVIPDYCQPLWFSFSLDHSVVFVCSLHDVHRMNAYRADHDWSACFNSRTPEQLLMKFGMGIIQLEANTNSYVLISYKVSSENYNNGFIVCQLMMQIQDCITLLSLHLHTFAVSCTVFGSTAGNHF
jgi:hypothetical protein